MITSISPTRSTSLPAGVMPFYRYQPAEQVKLTDRAWPDKVIQQAPRWLSTDLRDGNQALVRPMTPARKLKMFELLTRMGYKEIEVGFPAASQDEFDFVRLLIKQDRIPADVRISVLTQARPELIDRTVASLAGAHSATLHLYNATAPLFRRVVFGIDSAACVQLALRGTRHLMRAAESSLSATDLSFEYSPEAFTDTELDFAVEICTNVLELWQPATGRDMILNFPSTVERSTPNIFADQIEWLHRHLPQRERFCLSIHPHNDRGTAVAATELALMAGAERVEGCLFGNGERAGNVCLVTLGLNLFSQGVDPRIDFSDLDGIRHIVESCTELPVHHRHPYAGEFVYTAFSGAHQDAISKGFEALRHAADTTGASVRQQCWDMPYLPIDPKDIGRDYEAVIRLNSQSGKGGVAYIMSTQHGVDLPRGLEIEFARVVQVCADSRRGEITSTDVWSIFDREYLLGQPSATLLGQCTGWPAGLAESAIDSSVDAIRRAVAVRGDAAVAVGRELAELGVDISILDSHTGIVHKTGQYVVYVRCLADSPVWGVGLGDDVIAASMKAVLSAVRRSAKERKIQNGRKSATASASPTRDASAVRQAIYG
jgi:2-isopropylmalate synthase